MLILAIDTSGQTVSAALLEKDKLILQLSSSDAQPGNSLEIARGKAGSDDTLPKGYTRKRSKRGSKTSRIFPPGASELLVPMVGSLVEQTSTSFDQIGLIALTNGPGLFTGLRVAVVTAKAFAYSTGAELIGVNSLEVIAAQTASGMDCSQKPVCAVLNAQRKQLFCGRYEAQKDWQVKKQSENRIVLRDDWLDEIGDEEVLVTGTGLRQVVDSISDKPNVVVADPEFWDCKASSVGKYAWQQYELGRRDDFWKLQPVYFRPSSAEEIRDQRALKLKNETSS